ncbi:MAG: hypothetical protein Q7R95_08175 [bacterium]|nr:hypothetical protein [bacterium]
MRHSTLEGGNNPDLRKYNYNLIVLKGTPLLQQATLRTPQTKQIPGLVTKDGTDLTDTELCVYIESYCASLRLSRNTLPNPIIADYELEPLSSAAKTLLLNIRADTFIYEGSGFMTALVRLGEDLILKFVDLNHMRGIFDSAYVFAQDTSRKQNAIFPMNLIPLKWTTTAMQDLGYSYDKAIINQFFPEHSKAKIMYKKIF